MAQYIKAIGSKEGEMESWSYFLEGIQEAEVTLTSGVKGVYVEDECVTDGILADITVYRDTSPIQFRPVALRAGDATIAHIDKIDRVFGWQLGERYKIKVKSAGDACSVFEVRVNSTGVDPLEDYRIQSTPRPQSASWER